MDKPIVKSILNEFNKNVKTKRIVILKKSLIEKKTHSMSSSFFWQAFSEVPQTASKLLPTVGFNALIVWANEKIEDMSSETFPNNNFVNYLAQGATKTLEQAYLINIIGAEEKLPQSNALGSLIY
jgi:hypothetical protein